MKSKNILKFILIFVIANFIFGNAISEEKKKPKAPKMPQPLVSVQKVKMIEQKTAQEYIGIVQAIKEVDIQPRVSGFITGIKFQEGSLVKKSALLVTIEDTEYEAKVLAAKAALAQAEAEMDYAESNFKRQKKLSGKKAVVSKATLEDAERLVKLSRAKCNQQKADLISAENELSYTKIYAPIKGRIGKVSKTEGNYVSQNSHPLAKIVSMDPIQVKFSISEREYQNLFKTYTSHKQHLDISLKLSNGDKYPEKGTVDFVDNMVDDETGTISVWVSFKNPDMILIPGGYVTATVSESLKKTLPGMKVSGMMTDHKGNYVYVLGPGNIPERRDVELGDFIDSYYTIKKGLKAGEMVIVDGTHKVIPGMPVKPVPVEGQGKIKKN